MVAEAVGGKKSLNVLLIFRCGCAQLLDKIGADDLFLDRQALFRAAFRRGSGLTLNWQFDAVFSQRFVGRMNEVEHFRHPDVWDGLVDDFLDFDWCDADGERWPNHYAILTQGLRRDHRCELNHQSRSGIETAVAEDLVEGEIVEDLDQLWVRYRQRGDVT